VFVQQGGAGDAVLLLHGFPQTHLMWRGVALQLASDFRVVVADLPGYGASDCPPRSNDHSAMSKRSLAATLVAAMHELGHSRFAVVGHDRGGRVAYRLALDYPDVVTRVAVLDVVPTAEVWDRADAQLALSFWPFSLLAQPSPLPERLIGAAPDAVVHNALSCWGTPPHAFPDDIRRAYVEALTDPEHVHAVCEEYRAAATIDREHDAADRTDGLRIRAPLLVLWSATGAVGTWYNNAGGPLELWRSWADNVRGHAIEAGHFFPEETPNETAQALQNFLIHSG
jgi:haloacetate dehalogenase